MHILLALAAAAGAPQPGELKTFKDWTVGCDNGLACQAVGLLPEDQVEGATITVQRDADANALPKITITSEAKATALAIDDAPSSFKLAARDGFFEIPAGQALAFTVPLAKARRIALIDAKGSTLATISLAGASAALRYIDDKQRRSGTTTALVAKGPLRVVPKPPALPAVTMPPASAALPAKFRATDVRKYNGDDGCGVSVGAYKPEAYRLDVSHTLLMVPAVCGNGAYNYFTTPLILPNQGTPASVAKFDAPSGMGEPGNSDPSLVNASYDAKSRRLSTYAKGRGIGDCGVTQKFVWDGSRFRLVEQAEMGECRGSVDYIRTWRAVVR